MSKKCTLLREADSDVKMHKTPKPSKVEMLKKRTPLWREARVEVKMYKAHLCIGPLLEVEISKKCTLLWREAHVRVKIYKTPQLWSTFGS